MSNKAIEMLIKSGCFDKMEQGKTREEILLQFCSIMANTKNKLTSKLLDLGLSFVLGGAVGNMIDRVILGYVVDFIDFRIINFPVFNVADIFVVIGAIILVIFYIFY